MRYNVIFYLGDNVIMSSNLGFLPRICEYVKMGTAQYKVDKIIYEMKEGNTIGQTVYIILTH